MLTTIEQKVQCPNTDEAPLFRPVLARLAALVIDHLGSFPSVSQAIRAGRQNF